MKAIAIAVVVAIALAVRLGLRRRRRPREAIVPTDAPAPSEATALHEHPSLAAAAAGPLGDVGLVAMREIRERVRGRIFQGGTVVVLLVVIAAVVIPTIHSSASVTTQTVAINGPLSPRGVAMLHLAAKASGDRLRIVEEPSLAAVKAALRSKRVDVAVLDGRQLLLWKDANASSSPADPAFVERAATYLGALEAYRAAGLTPSQLKHVLGAAPLPVRTIQPSTKSTSQATAVIGLILLFFMLTQYCSWILIGVMQEKSSRVAEVLLSTLRPIELLGGKVLGIGLVAIAQATLVVSTALVVGAAVGSDLLRGTSPLLLVTQLLWLLLGYAFYCWLYAAAGSTAERQDQVQTLALPLSIPILVAYVFSITVASSGNPDVVFRVLAYVPPTAPFCMPVLVSLHLVTWWQFLASVLITIGGIALMARFAALVYQRAILRTGGRARLRELLATRAR